MAERVPWAVGFLVLMVTVGALASGGWFDAHGAGLGERYADARYLTPSQVYDLLDDSPWPEPLHDAVVRIVRCESGLGGRPSITLINPNAIGDRGRAWGLLQIRIDVHPRLARAFNLFDPRENLIAGYVIYLQAGGSFAPWSCWP